MGQKLAAFVFFPLSKPLARGNHKGLHNLLLSAELRHKTSGAARVKAHWGETKKKFF